MKRVHIATGFAKQPFWKKFIAIPLIYLPILTSVPFMILGVLLVRTHLKFIGAHDLKSYWKDFAPKWASHRYTLDNQIVYKGYIISNFKWYWVFNCKMYCPLTIALISYLLYLVKIVENWWCPFNHDKKCSYDDAAIDASVWHLDEEHRDLLHPEDRANTIFHDEKH
jgi:hypothetical protein